MPGVAGEFVYAGIRGTKEDQPALDRLLAAKSVGLWAATRAGGGGRQLQATNVRIVGLPIRWSCVPDHEDRYVITLPLTTRELTEGSQ